MIRQAIWPVRGWSKIACHVLIQIGTSGKKPGTGPNGQKSGLKKYLLYSHLTARGVIQLLFYPWNWVAILSTAKTSSCAFRGRSVGMVPIVPSWFALRRPAPKAGLPGLSNYNTGASYNKLMGIVSQIGYICPWLEPSNVAVMNVQL